MCVLCVCVCVCVLGGGEGGADRCPVAGHGNSTLGVCVCCVCTHVCVGGWVGDSYPLPGHSN